MAQALLRAGWVHKLSLDRLPPPLLSLLLPPWLWVLSILNRLEFQRLFNSFLGSAFSLYICWFGFSLCLFTSSQQKMQAAQTVPWAWGGQQQGSVPPLAFQDGQGRVHWCTSQTPLQAGCYRILPSVRCTSPLPHALVLHLATLSSQLCLTHS